MFNLFPSGSQRSPSRSDRSRSHPPSPQIPSTSSTTTAELLPEQDAPSSWLPFTEDYTGPSLHSNAERFGSRNNGIPAPSRSISNGSRHTRSHSVTPPNYLDGPPRLRLDISDDADEKGKLKRRQQMVNPYMSPPLTNAPASESFMSGVERISRALSRSLDIVEDDFEDEFDDGMEERSRRSAGSGSSSSMRSGRELRRRPQGWTRDAKGKQRAVEPEPTSSILRIIEVEEDDDFSLDLSTSTLTSRDESTTTRHATVGDSTLDDPGSIVPSVRFPAIFNQGDEDEEGVIEVDDDVSTIESSTDTEVDDVVPLPMFPPRILPILPRATVDEILVEDEPLAPEIVEPFPLVEDVGPPMVQEGTRPDYRRGRVRYRPHPAYVGIRYGKRRMLRRKRRDKSQERGLSRDFFLVVTLCFGLACAGILIIRPTAMLLFGYDTPARHPNLDVY